MRASEWVKVTVDKHTTKFATDLLSVFNVAVADRDSWARLALSVERSKIIKLHKIIKRLQNKWFVYDSPMARYTQCDVLSKIQSSKQSAWNDRLSQKWEPTGNI